MELQYVASRKIWRSLRVAFYVTRKGLTTKRKFIMESYVKALRKYTHLIMPHKISCRSTARPTPAGHFFHLWERDELFSISDALQSPTCAYNFCKYNDADIDEELDHEVSGPVFGSPATEGYSPVCAGDVNISGASAGADEDEMLEEEIDDRAEEFIRRFYEQLRAQSHNY